MNMKRTFLNLASGYLIGKDSSSSFKLESSSSCEELAILYDKNSVVSMVMHSKKLKIYSKIIAYIVKNVNKR